jgi:GNAT superfamily N-acetyltransferase
VSAINIKTGKEQMDVALIHRFLSHESYWAKGISLELVNQSLNHSFCVGAFINNEQVGFARLITDYYTFGWLADVFVLPPHRGTGISKQLVEAIIAQPWCKRLRRLMLNTSDAHGLYRQYGFTNLAHPDFILELYKPNAHLMGEE